MQYKRKALVLGAGGFIGSHMVRRLVSEGILGERCRFKIS